MWAAQASAPVQDIASMVEGEREQIKTKYYDTNILAYYNG